MDHNHSLDPLDSTTTAQSMPDRSDVSTIYPDPSKPNLGRIVQEDERQRIKQDKQDHVMLSLRHLGPLVGLLTGIPMVGGIALFNIVSIDINTIDRNILMPVVFLLVLLFGVYIGVTIAIIKWVRKSYSDHLLKAWPVTVTVLASLFLVAKTTFSQGGELVGGTAGYGASIGALLATSTLLTTILVLIWTTPKLSGLVKMIVLLVTIGAAALVSIRF